tara:strand:+ start:1238 stop:1498 length:261 start_codon:yes stop_codon:yes gene_type:complete
MTTEDIFNSYVEKIRNSTPTNNNVSNDEKLDLYKYYKQAKIGDCNIPKPSFFNITDSARWSAWNDIKGLSKEEAMKKYIMLCKTYV